MKTRTFPMNRPTPWAKDDDYLLGIGREEGTLESADLIEEWELPRGLNSPP
ncbi:hypothetical protein P9D51_07695 [Bacillus sonorensis]|uniref:hypothetical protein n=1 Tax=Bacillus sonorensis TaxID=119858 RepID=UPI0012DE0C45|nr:hypothetical protein [Bacillus sonorensis]MCF7617930.1 hypothetical protein [Bacillus sonorensis]MCY7856650.1 hypothetical protein [Bacillus sonorensis]MCY8036194.1 hypothetical protein [Bacillus sonorensis]MCY8564721.1 hypothetical protein [Bacillus sonorensis]MCZ0067602.1 hypothetical protein [Bacillus sonorensis]